MELRIIYQLAHNLGGAVLAVDQGQARLGIHGVPFEIDLGRADKLQLVTSPCRKIEAEVRCVPAADRSAKPNLVATRDCARLYSGIAVSRREHTPLQVACAFEAS